MTYVKTIKNDDEIKEIYNSLHVPLLIINQSVYQINSECITSNFGKDNSASDNGGGSDRDVRHSGSSTVNENNSRGSGGSSDKDARHSGSSSNDSDDEKNTRKSGSSTSASDGGSNNVRNSGSSISYYCEMNTLTQKLILHIGSVNTNAQIRVFYDNSFIDSKYYKIKSL